MAYVSCNKKNDFNLLYFHREHQLLINMKLIRFPLMLERSQLDHKDYQEEGVSWCCDNELAGHAGGIIADEMGLGKTITMIGTLLENFRTRTLVVLPVALLEQWAAQVYKLVGHKPLIYHGRGKNVDMESLLKAPLVLTTYGMININPKRRRLSAPLRSCTKSVGIASSLTRRIICAILALVAMSVQACCKPKFDGLSLALPFKTKSETFIACVCY